MTTNRKQDKLRGRSPASRTDWARLQRMQSGQEPVDTSDIAEAGAEFFAGAEYGNFANKTALSVRFDTDMVNWFKAKGPRYQTRMNQILRAFMLWSDQQAAKRQ
jgi:uncharacterized protein (DUF4415 family)